MSGVKARKWVLRSHFSGMPKREDLEIVEEELPPIKDGGQATCGLGRSQTQTGRCADSFQCSITYEEGGSGDSLLCFRVLCSFSRSQTLRESGTRGSGLKQIYLPLRNFMNVINYTLSKARDLGFEYRMQ